MNYTANTTLPAENHFAIVPSDGTDLAIVPRCIILTAAGNVAMHDADGVAITYTLLAGVPYPFRPKRILATGTTATGIIGWY